LGPECFNDRSYLASESLERGEIDEEQAAEMRAAA